MSAGTSRLIKSDGAPAPEGDRSVLRVPVDIRSAALTLLTILALILVLQYAQAVVIPIVLGVLISYALNPVVKLMAQVGLPRPLAAGFVLLALVALLGTLAYALRGQVTSIIEDLPQAARRIRLSFERDRPGPDAAIEQVQEAAAELEKAADAAADDPAPAGVTRVEVREPAVDVRSYLWWGSMGLLAGASQAVMILFLSFFFLASGDLYRRKLVKITGPSFEKRKITVQILDQIDRQIEAFLLVQVFTSVIVGAATYVAFRWVGLEQAAVWGVAAGVLNSIPYLGPVIVTGGTAFVAFMQFGDLGTTALVASMALAITTLEGFLLTPYLTSRAARMNAVAIFIGLLFWGWIWNVWGVLLAVPMLMVIKAICDHVEDFKAVGEILGE